MSYPRMRDHPEAVLKVLLTVIEKTPMGGATLEELKEAYCEVKDRLPSDKTIRRIIRRINLLFDPLAYNAEEEGEEITPRAIEAKRRGGKLRYVFTKDLAAPRLDPGLALLLTLSLYPRQRQLLPDQFEVLMKLVFESVFHRLSEWQRLKEEMERYVYVSGYGPANPKENLRLVERILQAIRLRKRVRLSYWRSYDGELTVREVEPYGLLCRHGVWYLVGRCLAARERRVFRLDHIERLDLVEKSIYSIPDDFSLREAYTNSWGVWTEEEPGPVETVRLKVAPGLAHKFRVTRYHPSQVTEELPDGWLEVRFELCGVEEMIPWLLGWGTGLEVLEPAWLREGIVEALEEMLSLYRRPGEVES